METGLIIGLAIEATVGMLCIVLGFLVWKKQKVSLIHDYHYRHVKKADIPAYARQLGIGLIIIGTGICLTGIINLLNPDGWGLIALGIGLVIGTIVMHKAQMKYNGSWFS